MKGWFVPHLHAQLGLQLQQPYHLSLEVHRCAISHIERSVVTQQIPRRSCCYRVLAFHRVPMCRTALPGYSYYNKPCVAYSEQDTLVQNHGGIVIYFKDILKATIELPAFHWCGLQSIVRAPRHQHQLSILNSHPCWSCSWLITAK